MTRTRIKPQQAIGTYHVPPEGYMLNGKIVPSVASNNLTVAIKNLAGNDPTPSDPVIVRIGDTVRSITAALSATYNAGTNWLNMGSAELATKEVDLFVMLGWDTSIKLGITRKPRGEYYSSGDPYYSGTTTSESGVIWASAAADNTTVENIGRFAATLSAGAGYTWSVPTFTASNLIQRPIYETRPLVILLAATGFTAGVTALWYYKVKNNVVEIWSQNYFNGTSNATTMTVGALPFACVYFSSGPVLTIIRDNGADAVGNFQISASTITLKATVGGGAFTNSGNKLWYGSPFNYTI